ncbi:MAG: F0F1 ATP synthase subunit delta [Hyphomicrobiaceae bacterium]
MASEDPMMASVAGRYASALFDLASEQKQLAEVEQDVIRLQGLLASSEDLRRMVRSPVISAAEQGQAIGAIAQKSAMSPLGINFLKLLARNRRLFAIDDIAKSFRQFVARHRGEVNADVTSAHALTEAQMAALEDTLKASAGGKNIKITTHVDPALLGGLVVKMGSRMIDSSLRTKLDNLKTRMKEVR